MREIEKGEKLQAVVIFDNPTSCEEEFDLQSVLLNDDSHPSYCLEVCGRLVVETIINELYLTGVQEVFLCSSIEPSDGTLSNLQKLYASQY